ncbi:MAG TPA: hypothetical protein VLB44_17765 [Kofleriaceae bacterium]|nr:hypothetical protein [Kofleriaceae bacterium]
MNYVERVILVAQHAERQGIGAPVVPLEQRPECIAVAFACRFNQLAVIDWVTSGGRSLALLIHAGQGYITATARVLDERSEGVG